MKKLFTHENRLIVFNLKNLLQEQGIECMVNNEFAGGGVGDLSPFETWPELWVIDETQFDAAQLELEKLQQHKQADIFCPYCAESNGSRFRICWNCGRDLL